tara:strand:+ start:6117 stop:6812 length:696 start_codon:yes stop_codon:yes gene_type:complete
LKKSNPDIFYGIQPILAVLAMWVTQDIAMRFFFRRKTIIGKEYLHSIKGSIILAPTHRSRWDGLLLTLALGRRETKKDCRFMVTNPEMVGLQGWFLKRLGCFSINQDSPSLSSLRYALNLIVKKKQLVIFPEGKINKHGKKLPFKQGLFRLAQLAKRKGSSVSIVPIGIAYNEVIPKFRGEVALCIEAPLNIDNFSDLSIDEFNNSLRNKINNAESKALNQVGRCIGDRLE